MNNISKILIVAATKKEITAFLEKCKIIYEKDKLLECNYANIEIDFLITGVGTPFTIFHLTRQLENVFYELVINAGIAGSFSKKIRIGDVVHVISDCFADLGVENNEEFSTIFEEKLFNENSFPFKKGKLINENFSGNALFENLKTVAGITVNKVHGNQKSIDMAVRKFNPEIETMEGAAFFYVCQQMKLDHFQIRSISNKVEIRNKMNWDIPLAISNLNNTLIDIIDSLIIQNK